MPVRTLPELVQRAVHAHGPRTALRYEREGDWHPITYAQVGRLVEEAAAGLVSRGVEPGQPVAILADGGPQAAIAELAILHAGAIVVPLDASLTSENARAALAQVEPAALFVDPGRSLGSQGGALEAFVVTFEASPGRDREGPVGEEASGRCTMRTLYRDGQRRLGAQTDLVQERWRSVDADDPALHVPSGEAASPGFDVPHAAIVRNAQVLAARFEIEPGFRLLSLLGPGEDLDRALGSYATCHRGGERWFARSAATFVDDLRACRPALALAPGDAYRRLRDRLEERLAASEATQRRLFAWARSVGGERAEARRSQEGASIGLRLRHELADRLVLAKVRTELGLGDLEALVAPPGGLGGELTRWLNAIGVPVLVAYTHPVAGGVVAARRCRDGQPGIAGRTLPGVEVRLDGAGSGEILLRGANRDEGRAEPSEGVGSPEGWMATGDEGHRDAEGRLHVEELARG